MPDFTMCANSLKCPERASCRRSIANTDPGRLQSWALFYSEGAKCRAFWQAPKHAIAFTPPRYDDAAVKMLDTIEDD